jgi:hypothetical protein
MKQRQEQDQQQQQQEQRRDGGDERRKPDPMPGMDTQERKDAQEKAQQEREHKTD